MLRQSRVGRRSILLQNATQKALFIHGRDEWVFLLWWIEWGERDEG
jgi:hypothetical protein